MEDFRRAGGYMAENMSEEAVEKLESAVEKEPDNRAMRRALATALLQAGGPLDEAVGHLEYLIENLKAEAFDHHLLGIIHHQREDYEAAIGSLQLAREQGFDDLDCLTLLGSSYIRLGKNEEALQFATEILEREESKDAHRLAAMALQGLGDDAAANEHAKRAQELAAKDEVE
ncbi:tetratricopeptide repeat protein [Haloferula helveola]